ncbi:MAG: glutamate carboxypeptidase [Aquabacterium sp.]
MITCRRALALSLACLSFGVAQARDDALLQAARAEHGAVVQTLKELVAIESGTMDLAGLARIADAAEVRLKALGMAVERRQPGAGRADVLIGRLQGNGQRRIMLMAHLDTIYFPGTLASQPLREDGNRLYGPGIADDKGGVAVILHALALLQRQGWRDYASLTVLLNGDEESGSRGSGPVIAALAAEQDVVLSFEPTAATTTPQGEGVLLAAAGAGQVTLQVKGRSAHAGAAPQLGRNALVEAAHQMLKTADVAKSVPGAQLNWTMLSTGTVRNQIPESASVGGDVRVTRHGADEQLLAALRAKVAEGRLVPDTETTVSLSVGRPPFTGDARTQALAERARRIYAELDGRKLALHPIAGGATDAGYASQSGKAAVLESLGLPGAGYHARDEYIELDTIVPRLYLAARMLMQLGQTAP